MGIQDPLRITREHVDGFVIEIVKGRRGKPLSPASVFAFTKDVQAFINYVADEIAPEDWRNPVRKLKHPQVAIHPLSYGQIASLLEVANRLAPTPELKSRSRAMLYVLLDGAIRISELMNAMKHHLMEEGILRVYGKGAKERDVALASKTLTAIQDYQDVREDKSPFLFVTEDGEQLAYEGVKSLFQRWRKADPTAFQGVRLSAHTLRHTSATMRRVAGMSEGDLQTFLGHSTPSMTRHYSAFALSTSANKAAKKTSPIEAMLNPDRPTSPS
jgi:integrase/recombinase XerD